MLGLRSGYRGGRCHDHSRLRCNLRPDRLSAVGRGSAVSALIPQNAEIIEYGPRLCVFAV